MNFLIVKFVSGGIFKEHCNLFDLFDDDSVTRCYNLVALKPIYPVSKKFKCGREDD